MDGFSCRDTKLVLFRFLRTFFTLVLVLKWKLTNFEKNTTMYIFDTNNNKLYKVDEKLSSAQNKLLYMGYWIGAESHKIKVICSPASIGRGYEIIEENDYKRLEKAREENAKYMDNNVRVIKREEEEREARIAAQDRSMRLKREAEKKEKEEAIHAAQRREWEVRKMEEEKKRRNEAERRRKQEEKMRLEQEREDQQHKQSRLPVDDDMPKWFIEYIEQFSVNAGRQSGIRETYLFDRNQWLEYLCDSSFPSTFMAGYKIVKNLLENAVVASYMQSKESLSLADIGCGNGGATIGVITAIEECLPEIKSISVEAYDCNKYALDIFKDCLEAYSINSNIEITPTFQKVAIVAKEENDKKNEGKFTLDSLSDQFFDKKSFDFILCFKMINELILNHHFDIKKAYYDFFNIFAPHLSDNGVLIVLDVYMSAEKDEEGKILDKNEYGKELNRQGRVFVVKHSNYKAIVPIPCALVMNGCEDKGFCMQIRRFQVKDGRGFPATYKVICKEKFATEIIKSLELHDVNKYVIAEKKDRSKEHCHNNGSNKFSKLKERICQQDGDYYDGYDLKSDKQHG